MPITGLSGNEIYCLDQIGYTAGDILIGNSVHSLGFLGSLGSGFKAIAGGEIEQFTRLIEEGRHSAYARMETEARQKSGNGITGVNSELVFHGGNIEFLSVGSSLHAKEGKGADKPFSTCADGQELYAQVDAGYHPLHFVFGNVAYSIGLTGGLVGTLKSLGRGEVKEFSNIFNQTRHLALKRLTAEARKVGANAVVGIQTSILPLNVGVQEMLMIGTASHNPDLPFAEGEVITSDLTCQEMWNMTKLGYAPMRLLLGTSVYSLGFVGGVTSFFKSFVRGEITELSKMIYDAREHALALIENEAKAIGADEVVGVKTYVYQLGSGLIEFMAMGTAMKKVSGLKTHSEQLLLQSMISDRDTFVNAAEYSFGRDLNQNNR